jgi:23S rRNA pseudouridine1911/1915/1917 synthase
MSIRLRVNSEHAGKRLDWFLHEHLPEYSRSRLQTWIKDRRVHLDGAPARSSHILRGGEQIELTPADLPPLKATAEELPIVVLYEDQDVVVIDKPAGMVVHAGAGHHEGTLVNALLHHFGQLSAVGGDLRPGIVHRLDKDTSGVLVVARTDRAHQSLAAQFQSRDVEKIYLALVQGSTPDEGTISHPIARDPVRRTRMTARLGTGRKAVSQYRTLERIGKFSYVQVRIGTGRTHQIRVHLATIGHAIVGDTLYGAARYLEGMPALGRFFLHAASLRFRSPSTGDMILVESRLPGELANWLELLKQRERHASKDNKGS